MRRWRCRRHLGVVGSAIVNRSIKRSLLRSRVDKAYAVDRRRFLRTVDAVLHKRSSVADVATDVRVEISVEVSVGTKSRLLYSHHLVATARCAKGFLAVVSESACAVRAQVGLKRDAARTLKLILIGVEHRLLRLKRLKPRSVASRRRATAAKEHSPRSLQRKTQHRSLALRLIAICASVTLRQHFRFLLTRHYKVHRPLDCCPSTVQCIISEFFGSARLALNAHKQRYGQLPSTVTKRL